MFSIQKWFSRDDEFLKLLEASARAGQECILALQEVLSRPASLKSLDAFSTVRREDKTITSRINELLARTSITSLDPEDIEALAYALYKIPKTVEKFAERYVICPAKVSEVSFAAQVELAGQAAESVTIMIRALKTSNFPEINAANQKLQIIEGNADKLMLQLLTALYNSESPTLTVILVKDLHELLEKVIDRCRDVGNIVANVVLKHS